jgi:hypothetical protein
MIENKKKLPCEKCELFVLLVSPPLFVVHPASFIVCHPCPGSHWPCRSCGPYHLVAVSPPCCSLFPSRKQLPTAVVGVLWWSCGGGSGGPRPHPRPPCPLIVVFTLVVPLSWFCFCFLVSPPSSSIAVVVHPASSSLQWWGWVLCLGCYCAPPCLSWSSFFRCSRHCHPLHSSLSSFSCRHPFCGLLCPNKRWSSASRWRCGMLVVIVVSLLDKTCM